VTTTIVTKQQMQCGTVNQNVLAVVAFQSTLYLTILFNCQEETCLSMQSKVDGSSEKLLVIHSRKVIRVSFYTYSSKNKLINASMVLELRPPSAQLV